MVPHQKLFGDGLSTPIKPLSLICTISWGDSHWGKKEKNDKYSWYSVQGPGRIAQTPQAGTGDSVSRFRRYHCSTVINYDSYFLVDDQFCLQLLFTTYILGLLPNIQNVKPLSTQCRSLSVFTLWDVWDTCISEYLHKDSNLEVSSNRGGFE